MASEGIPDRDILSAMKVSELRQLCSDHGFLVSGKKHDLVDRLLGLETPSVETPEVVTESKSEDIDDAIDKLIARVSGDEATEPEPRPEAEPSLREEPGEVVIEAEIVEADLVEPEPEEPEAEVKEEPETVDEDPWFSGVIPSEATDEVFLDEDDDEEPSMIITLPSVDGLKENWQAISAITVVVLLVGAIAFYLVQQDPAFTARPLRYGDHMDFTVTETTIEITGDEMIGILRDITTPTLDEFCDELRATVMANTSVTARSPASWSA